MRIGSLFSGIGGLELGLEWSGLGHTVWQVEPNEYCKRVLARHWPGAERYDDVRAVGFEILAPVDLICGGFPCQDVSSAGSRAGLTGSRSGLWFEYLRIVSELRPEWVVVENVAGGAKLWIDAVCSGMGDLGYETLPVPLSAQNVGAPHLRPRVFVIAHASGFLRKAATRGDCAGRKDPRHVSGRPQAQALLAREHCEDLARTCGGSQQSRHWQSTPEFRRVDNGFPRRLDRMQALGNAVVPQCAEVIGWMISELSTHTA